MQREYDKITGFADDLLAQSTPQTPVWNKEIMLGHNQPGWNYIDGCMLKAILDLYDAEKNQKYLDFADAYIDYYVGDDGSILGYNKDDFNSDSINEGKVLFTLHRLTGKEKYLKAINRLYSQLESQPRTKAGNFWHKLIYPNQVWLDGLYMTLPFYTEYETRFNGNKNIRDIFMQFTNVYENMRDLDTGLFYHAWDEARECFWADAETGLSKNFWSRSLGWYAMALLDSAEQMDETQFYERETLIERLREVLDALLKAADPDTGMFWQVTVYASKEGNYLETSASCAMAYSLMKGARLDFLPEYYYNYGKRIFDSIVKHKFIDGQTLCDICLVAGLGVYSGKGDYEQRDGTFEYYISEPKVDNDAKGVAPFLMAFSEVLRKEAHT